MTKMRKLSKAGLRERERLFSTFDKETLEILKKDKRALSVFNALAELIAESKSK